MRLTEINIRDPFILAENGIYYMYGTRAENFGRFVGGFDVYISRDLTHWSDPIPCFDSAKHGLNREVNWAPEVHRYRGAYYMFATFTGGNGLRGTYSLVSDTPEGPFCPTSDMPLTPEGWECLDGTLYISANGTPYLVFCHEHTQIIDGAMCYVELDRELRRAVGEPITLFYGSSPYYIEKQPDGEHYITDGPFLYRTVENELLMIWSTVINGDYSECIARSDNGEIDGNFIHLEPLIRSDGGHGMIFRAGDRLCLTYHTPNRSGYEHPSITEVTDDGKTLTVCHGQTV